MDWDFINANFRSVVKSFKKIEIIFIVIIIKKESFDNDENVSSFIFCKIESMIVHLNEIDSKQPDESSGMLNKK